ncbi:MAG: PorT family protein [Algoriphagus sp.]|jgi:hypothetical protein|nr:PorT family protein [Algoriphagus sp.]
MKKLLTIALISLSFLANAQETEKKPKTPIGGRPNIPNDLNIEFGFNQLTNRPADLSLNFFGSRSFHIYYQVPIKIFGEKSGFTVNPGFGVGSEKFSFQDEKNLFRNATLGPESSELKTVKSVYGNSITVSKNTFAANYFEVPVDLVYHFNKNSYSKSFRVSIGGKIGYLYNAHTKIGYESATAGEVKIKSSENFGLEKLRYGVSLKAGSPGFYVWSNIYLNGMWQADRGPFNTEASQVNFGIAVSVF